MLNKNEIPANMLEQFEEGLEGDEQKVWATAKSNVDPLKGHYVSLSKE